MSRLMNADQHSQLMLLRGNMAASVLANDAEATQRSMGMVQGYLLGLYAANEIDFGDVQALEDEVMQGITFLMNARKVVNAN
jgi:hypothetical protein